MRNYLIILFLFLATALVGITINGHITRNTTWRLSESPYIVDGYVYIDAGVTLTIEPGVQIKVKAANADTDWNGFRCSGTNEPVSKMFMVNGRIIAIGTQAQPIVFDKYETAPTWRWGGIYISETAPKSSFVYCEFRSVSTNFAPGEYYHSFSATMRFQNGAIDLRHCTFYDFYAAIVCTNLTTEVIIYDCKFISEHSLNYSYYPYCFGISGAAEIGNQEPMVLAEVTIANCYFSGVMNPYVQGYYVNTNLINNKFINQTFPEGARNERMEFGCYKKYGNYYENSESNIGCSMSCLPDTIYSRRNIVINALDSEQISCGSFGDASCNAYISDNYFYGNVTLDIVRSHFYNNIVRTSAVNAIDYNTYDYPTLSKIYNNVFICENPSIYKSAISAYDTSADISNNIFYGFNNIINDYDNTITLRSNIFYDYYHVTCDDTFDMEQYPLFSYNCFDRPLPTNYTFVYGDGNIVGEPLFVNADSLDFHLQAGSPCIDAGQVADWIPAFDGNYNQRVMGVAPDMGAFEANSVYIGGIAGNVYDIQTRQQIDCARISISGKLPEFSDSTGHYVFPTGVGNYTLTVKRWDYQDVVIPNVSVALGQELHIDIPMTGSSTPADDDTNQTTINAISLNNYPNPFNPETTICFDLPEKGMTELAIYNVKGQKVKTLVNDLRQKGLNSVKWDGRDEAGNQVASGIYFASIKTGNNQVIHKLMHIK